MIAWDKLKSDARGETMVVSRSNFLDSPSTSISGRLLSSGSWILKRLVGSTRANSPLLLQKAAISNLTASCVAYISLPFWHLLKWSPLLSISVCLLQEHFRFGISVISARNRILMIVLNSSGLRRRAWDFGVVSRTELSSGWRN